MEFVVQQLLAVRPFASFQIRLANQDNYRIEEPDLAVVESGETIAVYRRPHGAKTGRERVATLALAHVVSVVEHPDHLCDIPY